MRRPSGRPRQGQWTCVPSLGWTSPCGLDCEMRARETADGGKLVGDQRALDGAPRDTRDARGSGRMGVGFRAISGAEVRRAGGAREARSCSGRRRGAFGTRVPDGTEGRGRRGLWAGAPTALSKENSRTGFEAKESCWFGVLWPRPRAGKPGRAEGLRAPSAHCSGGKGQRPRGSRIPSFFFRV